MKNFIDKLVLWSRRTLTGAIVLGILYLVGPHLVRDTIEVTVTKTETKVDQAAGTSKYLVYTDKGTFENTDSYLEFKTNSSDIYGKLQQGKTYTITVYGFRSTLLSWYKNIASIDGE